jgi:signal peptidase I
MPEQDKPAGPGGPRPISAFLLTLVSPGLGHRYAGAKRRGRSVHVITASLMGLAVVFAMLPPVNLPVLILMMLPLLALPAWLVVAGIGAAMEARDAGRQGAPAGVDSIVPVATGIVVFLIEIGVLAALLSSLSNIGGLTVRNDDMAPTLLEGDWVVTWPDYFENHLPARGDVAVVLLPGLSKPQIMRIIGLPGDSLLSVLGVLALNGEPIGRERAGNFGWRNAGGVHRSAPRWRETLPGGPEYDILQSVGGMFRGSLLSASLRIPDGTYFVIGDNRDETPSSWDFNFLPGEVLSDRPTVILNSQDRGRIGRSVQP